MSNIRFAFVGLGGIFAGSHAPAVKHMPELEVVGLCDIDEGKFQRANSLFPNARTYTDYLEMFKTEEPDAVALCLPNYLHSIVAVAALEMGIHVLCEKPDAVNVEEALKMKAASEKSGKLLMVMRNNRFLESSQLLKKYVEEGQMGDIYAGRCGWIRRRGIPGRGGWFTTKAQSGGGPLIDLGVHMIDLTIWLMGNPRPVAVSGAAFNKFANNEVDTDPSVAMFGNTVKGGTFDVEDLVMGFIRFDNGAVLQIEFSWASNIAAEKNFVELRGDKAGFTWENGNINLYSQMGSTLTDVAPHCRNAIPGHQGYYRNFVNVLLGREEPNFVPQQGVDMIRILCAIYRSAETGREVLLEEQA